MEWVYTRIYWSASQQEFGDAVFAASSANWQNVKRGINDILTRYDEPWNLNNFARFSCLAGDRPLAADLIARIGDRIVPGSLAG